MKIFTCIFLLLFLSVCNCFSQDSTTHVFYLNKISPEGILPDKGWKFHSGDNLYWANPDLDDSKWQPISLSGYSTYLPQLKNKNIGWFRLNLLIDSSLLKNQLAIQLSQLGASEIYLNGKLFQQFGSIKIPSDFKSFNPVSKPFLLPVNTGHSIVIAIRFASQIPSASWLFTSTGKSPLIVTINSWNSALSNYETILDRAKIPAGISYMYLALSLLFILLFIFFPREKINLLFGIVCFFLVVRTLLELQISQGSLDISEFGWMSYFLSIADMVLGILILSIISQVVLHRITFYHRIIFCSMVIDSLTFLIFGPIYPELVLNFLLHIVFTMAFLHLGVHAFRQRHYIIGIVALNSCIINLFYFLILYANLDQNYFNLSYPFAVNFIMITLYVSINFARKSKYLEVQLVEIEKLSADNLKKEQEKQQILALQNETLEQQVKERTLELTRSLEELQSTQAQLIQSEKMASLGELTAGIAHEIQNPLNFVNNFSEVNTELIGEMEEEIDKGNIGEVRVIAVMK